MTVVTTARPLRSARKAKGDGHLRRAEILEAAQRIFVEQGYEGATIRRIAEEVGLSSTALYMHFRDKSEILVEICVIQFAALNQINAELLAEDLDAVVRVRRMLEGYFTFAFDHPNVYRLAFCSPGAATSSGPDEIVKLGRRTYELFSEGVARIGVEGRLRVTDVDVAAQTSWAACHGIVSLMLTRPWVRWADRAVLQASMLDMVFAGLTRA